MKLRKWQSWQNFRKVLDGIYQLRPKYLIACMIYEFGHRIFNKVVAGSIPACPTTLPNKTGSLRKCYGICFSSLEQFKNNSKKS
tara:strand:+ start:216 stop:467 length:252 start_codon:yes stop_codon:yes gene_type:complete